MKSSETTGNHLLFEQNYLKTPILKRNKPFGVPETR